MSYDTTNPVPNDGTRDTQLRIAARATELAQALHRFSHDVPLPVDIANGHDLFPDQSKTDIADALLGAELALHSITGIVLASLGLTPTGGIGHGTQTGNGHQKVSEPR